MTNPRQDTARRSFLHLVAIALAPIALLAIFGCGPLALVEGRFAPHNHHVISRESAVWVALVFLAATAVGVALSTRSVWSQWRATRRLIAGVAAHGLPVEGELAATAQRVGLTRVRLLNASDPYSFTYGLLAPRVAVSQGLIETVSPAELEAVLIHEQYHVRSRDPLKVLIARALPMALFYIPVLHHLLDRYLTARELAADRDALARCGPAPLAGALYKVVAGPAETTRAAVAAIGGTELLDIRLAQLETGHEPPPAPISRRMIAGTVAGLILLAAGLGATVIAAIGETTVVPIAMALHDGPLDLGGGVVCVSLCVLAAVALYRWLAARLSTEHRVVPPATP